jgi:acyl carrier protein
VWPEEPNWEGWRTIDEKTIDREVPVKTEEQIVQFIESELLEGVAPGIDPLASGMLDSLAIEVLIGWLEDEFEISLGHKDVVAENFASVVALSAVVDAKRLEASGQPTRTSK